MDFNKILDGEGSAPTARGSTCRYRVRLLGFALLLVAAPAFAQIGPERGDDRSLERKSTASGFRKVAFYLPNRVFDFLDIWRFNAGIGLGAGINIRPTKSLQFGLAVYDSVRFGLRGRRAPFWHEQSWEGGIDGMYYEGGETERGFYEFGGTIHFFLVGLDAAFDIEEILDFGCGIFLSDPADDDFLGTIRLVVSDSADDSR